MSTPKPGARVRLSALRGVASPAMRAAVGKLGKVVSTKTQTGGTVLVEARFPGGADGAHDTFWLKPDEYELLDEPGEPVQSSAPPTKPVQEQPIVVDFRTAVQTRIDQLGQADAELARQIDDLAQQRALNARERRALEAAVLAYERTRSGARPEVAASTRAYRRGSLTGRAFLLDWAAAHGGVVATIEAVPASREAGLSPHAVKKAVADRALFDRVRHGLYRLRSAS